jgi:hypothetical protein
MAGSFIKNDPFPNDRVENAHSIATASLEFLWGDHEQVDPDWDGAVKVVQEGWALEAGEIRFQNDREVQIREAVCGPSSVRAESDGSERTRTLERRDKTLAQRLERPLRGLSQDCRAHCREI